MEKSYSKNFVRLIILLMISFVASVVQAQTPISINAQLTGVISVEVPQALYTFQGSAGQAVTISITANDPLRVQFGLFDGEGVLLFAGMNTTQSSQNSETVTLPQSGTYTLQIISSNGQQGTFNLTLSANDRPVAPASQSCEAIMRQIVTVLEEYCSATGRNQACYGNILVEAQPSERVADLSTFQFDSEGDILDLFNMRGMELSPMDNENGTWGVALMQVQANLPDSLPGTNVTMLVFGGMQVVDAATLNGTSNLQFQPMQSIYIRPGLGATRCENTPDHGMLIQTPEGAGQVELTINEVEINVGSTVFVSPDLNTQTLNFSTLEGSVEVTTNGVTQTATTGMKVSVPINTQILPAGPPNPPEPFDPSELELLPTAALLPSALEPITPEVISEFDSDECVARVVGDQRINVRFGPGTVYDVIGGLDVDEMVLVTGQSGGGWYAIDFNGYEAWVGGSVIELTGLCDNLPFAYVPPTPTPPATATPTATPTPIASATPIRPVAGDNEYPGVKVDYFAESPVFLTGAISDPVGDRQDTVSYALTNLQYAFDSEFRLSIRCSGEGAQHAIIIFTTGETARCHEGYNFIQYISDNTPTSGAFTIAFDNQVQGAYVEWSASLSFFGQQHAS